MLIKQLEVAGFAVVETDGAVDSKTLDIPKLVDLPMFEAVVCRYPVANEIGCAIAHLKAWQFLIDNDLDYLAVFEDDAVLLDFSVEAARSSTKNLRGPWYVALERRTGDYLLSHLMVRRSLSVRRCLGQPRGTGAYIISRQAANLGVAQFKESGLIEGISDRWPGPAADFKFYQILPPPFVVDPSAVTTIGVKKKRDFNRLQVLAKVLRVILSPRWDNRRKLGLLALKIRPMKYLWSIHFFTAWYLIRFGNKR